MYVVRSPFFLKWYYPSLIWRKHSSEKIVYLTFDDGPVPDVTDFVLNTLKSFNVKASFFCIGDNIRKHPEVFERIKLEGHAIGNHTYNHLKGWKTDDNSYISNFLKCQELTQTNLFRPPYGRIRKSQIQKLKSQQPDLDIVMWDVLSGDFDTSIDGEKCYQNVVKNVRSGSIIVFHDSLKAWDRLPYALPKTIEKLLRQGYKFDVL
jgi:peptidoglycan/xylan/chitin deacetylase (PgdA/CDA1 family)